MEDVSDEKMREMVRNMTPTERLNMGCAMTQAYKNSLIKAIVEENPQITEAGIKQQLFLRLYGDEFDEEQKEKILRYLAS